MAVVLRTTVPAHQVTVSGDMGSLAASCTAAMTVDYYKLGLQAAQLGADILEGPENRRRNADRRAGREKSHLQREGYEAPGIGNSRGPQGRGGFVAKITSAA